MSAIKRREISISDGQYPFDSRSLVGACSIFRLEKNNRPITISRDVSETNFRSTRHRDERRYWNISNEMSKKSSSDFEIGRMNESVKPYDSIFSIESVGRRVSKKKEKNTRRSRNLVGRFMNNFSKASGIPSSLIREREGERRKESERARE